MSVLSINNITKIFFNEKTGYTNQVLLGVSKELTNEQVNFIVGPSGSGKSTLLKILAGHMSPTAGEVILNDKPLLTKNKYYEDNIRLLNQNPYQNVFLDRSIRENFEIVASIHKMKNISDKMNELLSTFRLDISIQKLASKLSTGQIQRLGLCLNLLTKPEVLLLDEPTSHLDVKNSNILVNSLIDHQNMEGTLIIVTTHKKEFAKHGTTILLYKGQLIEPGIEKTLMEYKVQSEYYSTESIELEDFIQIKANIGEKNITFPKSIARIFDWNCNDRIDIGINKNILHFKINEKSKNVIRCRDDLIIIETADIVLENFTGYVMCNPSTNQIILPNKGGMLE